MSFCETLCVVDKSFFYNLFKGEVHPRNLYVSTAAEKLNKQISKSLTKIGWKIGKLWIFLSFEDFIIDQENQEICDVTCDQLYNKIQREICKIWHLNWMKYSILNALSILTIVDILQ